MEQHEPTAFKAECFVPFWIDFKAPQETSRVILGTMACPFGHWQAAALRAFILFDVHDIYYDCCFEFTSCVGARVALISPFVGPSLGALRASRCFLALARCRQSVSSASTLLFRCFTPSIVLFYVNGWMLRQKGNSIRNI